MRLGNSNGNNKGKKYLRKENIDEVFAVKADDFNKWMSHNFNSVVCFLKEKNIFEEDVFSHTYEKTYEKILYSGINENDYRAYFQRAYYTNYINAKAQNNRFTELLPIHEKDNIDTEYFAEIERKQSKLETDIMDYIYSNYELREYEIFKMYVNLKPSVNYKTLSKITYMKEYEIQRIVSKIKKDLVTKRYYLENNIAMQEYNTNPIKELDISYAFCSDYELLWDLRQKNDYTIICTVIYKGIKSLAELTPNGEIFNSSICFSDFEYCSKYEFIKQCSDLHVEFIKPMEIL